MKLSFVFYLILFAIAPSFVLYGQPEKGRSYFERLLTAQDEYRLALASGDSAEIAEWSYILGKRFMTLDNQFYAKRYFLQALRIRQSHGSPLDIGKVYAQLCHQAFYLNQLNEAEQYARLGFSYLSESGQPPEMVTAYGLLRDIHFYGLLADSSGSSLSYKPALDSVLYYTDKSIEMSRSISNIFMEGVSYSILGKLYLKLGKTEDAIRLSQKALVLFQDKEKEHFHQILGTYVVIGNSYMLAGNSKEAKTWFEKSNALADTTLGITYGQISNTHQAISDYYRKTGDWQNAFKHQRKAQFYREDEFEANRQAAEEGLRLFLDNEEKQLQLNLQNRALELWKQNSKIKTWLNIIIAVFFLGAMIAGLFFYRLFRRYETLSQENADLLDEQNHRIKNNLQSVRDLLELQSMRVSDTTALQVLEESMMRVEAIARVHHELYDGGRLTEVGLQKYIPDLVDSILYAYSRRDIAVSYELDDIWIQAETAIPLGLILNELMTNACKYAFNSVPDPRMAIGCVLKNDEIRLTFKDNGPGFDVVKYNGNNGTFGLRLITLLSGKLKANGLFHTENGTCYTLTFKVDPRKSQQNYITPTFIS